MVVVVVVEVISTDTILDLGSTAKDFPFKKSSPPYLLINVQKYGEGRCGVQTEPSILVVYASTQCDCILVSVFFVQNSVLE